MTFQIETAITGIHPRSEETAKKSRDFDRGRASQQELEKIFSEDAKSLITLESSLAMSYVSDGQLKWQDFIRPFSESLGGLKVGADLSRWFDTNTFYKKPTVVGEIRLDTSEDFLKRYEDWNGFPQLEARRKISLPGPFTLASLVDDTYYNSKSELGRAFARILSQVVSAVSKNNINCVQLNEPSLVYRHGDSAVNDPDTWSIFEEIMTKYLSNLESEIWLHTYFGDSSKILGGLLSLQGISAVGIDFTQTSLESISGAKFQDKKLGCGCVDARNSMLETSEWVSNFTRDAIDLLRPKSAIILPSSDLKYLPRLYADRKLRTISEAARQAQSG